MWELMMARPSSTISKEKPPKNQQEKPKKILPASLTALPPSPSLLPPPCSHHYLPRCYPLDRPSGPLLLPPIPRLPCDHLPPLLLHLHLLPAHIATFLLLVTWAGLVAFPPASPCFSSSSLLPSIAFERDTMLPSTAMCGSDSKVHSPSSLCRILVRPNPTLCQVGSVVESAERLEEKEQEEVYENGRRGGGEGVRRDGRGRRGRWGTV